MKRPRARPQRASSSRLTGNELLDRLTPSNRKEIRRDMVLVSMTLGDVIYAPNRDPRHVYFPQTAVLSFVVRLSGGPSVEATMTGCEGMAGIPALSSNGASSTLCVVQVAGDALRLSVASFRRLMRTMPQFGELQHRFTSAFVDQVSQTAACNRHHSVSQRCARWLLMTQDRVRGEATFDMTQAFLSHMLGIRREAVSEAASSFRRKKLITYTRGRLTIRSRRGLEAVSCECHRVLARRLRRLYA
jgi:CRP-like cAMP-binding protein